MKVFLLFYLFILSAHQVRSDDAEDEEIRYLLNKKNTAYEEDIKNYYLSQFKNSGEMVEYNIKYVNNNKHNILYVNEHTPRSHWKWNRKLENRFTNLIYVNSKINDLKGIEQLYLLESIDLSYNPVSNIEPISKLKHLKKLNLSYTKVSKLQPLSKVKTLEVLLARIGYAVLDLTGRLMCIF
jgi:Leucine-rich repeat (LRR) protein